MLEFQNITVSLSVSGDEIEDEDENEDEDEPVAAGPQFKTCIALCRTFIPSP